MHITGTSLLNIPVGVWGISTGFSFLPSSAVGDGAFNNVIYGLSSTQYESNLIKQNRRYNITFGSALTYESYADNTVVCFTKPSSLFLDAFINNAPGSSNGNQMSNSYITATLLSNISFMSAFRTLLLNKPPYAMYSSSISSNKLRDETGNGRDATCVGVSVASGT